MRFISLLCLQIHVLSEFFLIANLCLSDYAVQSLLTASMDEQSPVFNTNAFAAPSYPEAEPEENGDVEVFVHPIDLESCPLVQAAFAGDLERVRMLIDDGADIDQTISEKGPSALFGACETGHQHVVDFLIERKANVNQTATKDCSPSHIARKYLCFLFRFLVLFS